LKQSHTPHQELSNGMSHATFTQGNWGDSQLLMVENQIVNLIIGLSFAHNLCLKCPNGLCKPTLNIYVQELSNDITNSLIQWVLTPAIIF
jgi:hypothetical protein